MFFSILVATAFQKILLLKPLFAFTEIPIQKTKKRCQGPAGQQFYLRTINHGQKVDYKIYL